MCIYQAKPYFLSKTVCPATSERATIQNGFAATGPCLLTTDFPTMIKTLFSILALVLSYAALAQNPEADSLKRLVQNGKEDHEHVMNLEALSYAYLSSHPDTALQYALKGQALAKRINDAPGESSCVIALGNGYFHLGDYTKSLEMYLRAL